MKRRNWVCKGDSFEFDLYGEAEGLCSNPLIHFTIIKGRAVGLFRGYPLIHDSKAAPVPVGKITSSSNR